MYYLFYVFYAAVACFFLSKHALSKSNGLEGKVFYGLFLFKIFCSIITAYLFLHFYPSNDYAVYNRHGMDEYRLLLRNPADFFTNIFDSLYTDPYGNYFDASGSFWNDLRNNIIIKIVALFNLLSNGNFYINTLFFSLLSFWGQLALYKFFKQIYPQLKWPLIVGCFLLPSVCIFLSGIHKDAIVFCLLAFFTLHFYQLCIQQFRAVRFLAVVLLYLSILLLRNYVAFALLPVMAAFLISVKTKLKPALVFPAIYLILIAGIFVLEFIKPNYKPLAVISERQAAFLSLPVANTQLPMDTLSPTIKSFVEATPTALNHVFLHPYFGEFRNQHFFLYSLEHSIYVCLFVLMLIFSAKQQHSKAQKSGLYFGIFLGITMFLFIGYTIPAVGAIIRYKSVYLPFLITPILAGIDWNKTFKKSHYIK